MSLKESATMYEIRENKPTWRIPTLFGGDWDAGYTLKYSGIRQVRSTARLTEKNWEVLFRPATGGGAEQILARYPIDYSGEILAKNLVVEKLQEVWIRAK